DGCAVNSTNQGNATYRSCQSVTGTTIRSGSFPMLSMLMTTAGRILRISPPTEGSKLTSQISPRLGVGTVAMKIILPKCVEVSQVIVVYVNLFGTGRGGAQDCVALGLGKSPKLLGSPSMSLSCYMCDAYSNTCC